MNCDVTKLACQPEFARKGIKKKYTAFLFPNYDYEPRSGPVTRRLMLILILPLLQDSRIGCGPVGTGPPDPAAAGPIIWQTIIFMFTLLYQFS